MADFIAAVPDPGRRADAEVARALLEDVTGQPGVMWGPAIIGFGHYRGPTGEWPIIGFSPRKAQMVFYIMLGLGDRVDLLARLGKHKTGGGCLYVNRLSDVDLGVLRELAIRSVALMREKYPA